MSETTLRTKSEILKANDCPVCNIPTEGGSSKAGMRGCRKCHGLVEKNHVIKLRFNCPECKEPQLASPVLQIRYQKMKEHEKSGEVERWNEFQYFQIVICKIGNLSYLIVVKFCDGTINLIDIIVYDIGKRTFNRKAFLIGAKNIAQFISH